MYLRKDTMKAMTIQHFPFQGLHLLRDNIPLSNEQYERTRQIQQEIMRLVEDCDNYIRKHSINADFGKPSGFWSPDRMDIFFEEYRRMSSGSQSDLDKLRFFTAGFTGFDLFNFREKHGRERETHPETFNFEEYDEWFSKTHSQPDGWVRHWEKMVQNCSPDAIFSPPKMFGEIGWNMGAQTPNPKPQTPNPLLLSF